MTTGYMTRGPAILIGTLLLASVWCPLARPLNGQVGTTPNGEMPAFAFDVVSIRPSDPNSGVSVSFSADGYSSLGRPLVTTILTAYLPAGVQSRDLLIDAPKWVSAERYDFVGKVTAEDAPEWSKRRGEQPYVVRKDGFQAMLQPMLQAALAERCKLVIHRVPATIQGYELVVGKKGLNLAAMKEATPNVEIPPRAVAISDGGKMVPIVSKEQPDLTFYRTSMTVLAAILPFGWPTPVTDKTGLTGQYDFKLTRVSMDSDLPDAWDLGALGLKLVPVQVLVEKIVIDHIERPSPN